MARVVVSQNVSLDGVVQDPSGDEGFERGGWVGRIGDHGREEAAGILLDEARGADALLFGRRTYEFFAGRWPSRSGALADRLNSLPKYVVTSTLTRTAWDNSTVVTGDVSDEITKLKNVLQGQILVYGSVQLVEAALQRDLVDELRLMVYPVLLVGGQRLFGGTADVTPLRLVDVRAVGEDLARLTYQLHRLA
jgi:dihydrofolate reductase